jgi:hypothetical protein
MLLADKDEDFLLGQKTLQKLEQTAKNGKSLEQTAI